MNPVIQNSICSHPPVKSDSMRVYSVRVSATHILFTEQIVVAVML
jgi:hypothetical protein